ncbi:MAG: OsmC family protein [Planctomycetota bacterium]
MNLPHDYQASARLDNESLVTLSSRDLPEIESAPPKEFGGSGHQWSPEDLLVAAVADCFSLSFKAIAAASKFEWINLECDVSGTLDKVERAIQFTGFQVKAKLTVAAGADATRAERLLQKAEQACFITNSLKAEPHLEVEIVEQ